jgi:DNA repair protein RadA/Sms
VELPFGDQDVHTVVAGGVRTFEPGADLALALALASARQGVAVPPDVVACGEVGLGGEIRQVHQTERRLAEAARLGFRRAVVPASAPLELPDIDIRRVRTLGEAVRVVSAGDVGWRRAS